MILAVDTSCYTTSLCVIDLKGQVVFESAKLLKVKDGAKGLRQSEGFYQHVYALNEAFSEFAMQWEPKLLKAVVCSTRPRSVEGSYMPVFEAGRLFCDTLSKTLDLPLYAFSHQEGHIMAALKSAGLLEIPKNFYAMHLSGGTTEWTVCEMKSGNISIQLVGETLDISFGQLVDRIGVAAGLPFPAGQSLDDCAKKSDEKGFFKIPVKEGRFNLSGYENKYLKLLETKSVEDVSRHMFNTLAQLMKQWIESVDSTLPILIAGGVASNSVIKTVLNQYENVSFADAKYAKDNAYGTAFLGRMAYLMEQGYDQNESILSI